MARGFRVTITVHDPDWLTAGHVTDVAREQGQWLSEREVADFIPGAVEAAKALMGSVQHGPFFVTLQGVDSFGVAGEATIVTVSVDSAATEVPGQGPVTAIMSSSTEVEETASGPTGDEDVEPQASAAPASVEATSEEVPDGEAVDEGA